MKLKALQREKNSKCDVKRIRREGKVPAILYSNGKDAESILIDKVAFDTVLREIKQGCLSTTIFLLDLNGKERKAIVKDIQYNLTNYQVIHLDFEELKKDLPVQLKIPIFFTGVAECVGVKLGGFLRQVIRSIKVECLPEKIPSEFLVDVAALGMRQTRRLRDLVLPSGVKPLASLDEVLVVVAKR